MTFLKKSLSPQAKTYLFHLTLAIVSALVMRMFVVTAFKVPTGSMQPTLLPGDFIFVNRLAYKFAEIERGDVVAFRYPDRPNTIYVKRVVATEGDHVSFKASRLYINETPMEVAEPLDSATAMTLFNPNADDFVISREELISGFGYFILKSKRKGSYADVMTPWVVPPGEYFLMGDNRDTSDDSREWGSVPKDHILGKVSIVWFSMNLQARVSMSSVRWERIFTFVR